jgi:hypothetical protein
VGETATWHTFERDWSQSLQITPEEYFDDQICQWMARCNTSSHACFKVAPSEIDGAGGDRRHPVHVNSAPKGRGMRCTTSPVRIHSFAVKVMTQLVSQVLPPSSENACSKWDESGMISEKPFREKMALPLNDS